MLIVIFFVLTILLICIASLRIRLFININKNVNNQWLKVYVVGVPILKICIDKAKRDKIIKSKNLIVKLKKGIWRNIKIINEFIKCSAIRIEKFKINLKISTSDAPVTAITVGILSSGIAFLFKYLKLNISNNKFMYKIEPLYLDKFSLDAKLNCIICFKPVHITYVILKNIREWRSDVNGRKSSNRKTYDHCYE